jgi:hypothetical protein
VTRHDRLSTMRSTSVFFATSAASVATSPSRGAPPGLAADRLDRRDARAGGACWTIASPMPLVPPVTMATRPEQVEQVLRGCLCAHWQSSLRAEWTGTDVVVRTLPARAARPVRRQRRAAHFRSWRLITIRWIWLVPSQIWYTRTSR